MKKLLCLGLMLVVFSCAPRQSNVRTEGLEEVVVFGEDTANISEEPVLPEPTAVVTPAPPIAEEPVVPPITPPVAVEPIEPPPLPSAPVLPPPSEEVSIAPPSIPPAVIEEPVTPTPASAVAVPPPPTGILGFRVQIFASSTENNAQNIANEARSSFGGKIYVEHAAPYYKVRVGDCLTMDEAQVLKSKAAALGYRGAFIVETTINP